MAKHMMIVDVTPPTSITSPNPWYNAAANIVDFFDGLDKKDDVIVVKVRTPAQVYKALLKHGVPGMRVDILGHGGKGRPTIGNKTLGLKHRAWAKVKGGIVWFRMCWAANGEKGHARAREMNAHGVTFVAHISKIGMPWHSYLVANAPGKKPWWSTKLDPKRSGYWEPRTIWATSFNLPKWWAKRSMRVSK